MRSTVEQGFSPRPYLLKPYMFRVFDPSWLIRRVSGLPCAVSGVEWGKAPLHVPPKASNQFYILDMMR